MIKIELENKTINLRKPKLKDIRAVSSQKNEEEKTYLLVSNLTGLSEDKLNEISIKDFKKQQRHLIVFCN